jgi:hypothetical protein
MQLPGHLGYLKRARFGFGPGVGFLEVAIGAVSLRRSFFVDSGFREYFHNSHCGLVFVEEFAGFSEVLQVCAGLEVPAVVVSVALEHEVFFSSANLLTKPTNFCRSTRSMR